MSVVCRGAVYVGRTKSHAERAVPVPSVWTADDTTIQIGLPWLSLPQGRDRPGCAPLSALSAQVHRGRRMATPRGYPSGITVNPSTIDDGVRPFTPRFIDAARAHRSAVGGAWTKRTSRLVPAGAPCIGRSMNTARSSTCSSATAARRCFPQAIDTGDVTPTHLTTNTAKRYPNAVRAVLPTVEHRSSKYRI